jgi:arylsulfatase A-like enzyme
MRTPLTSWSAPLLAAGALALACGGAAPRPHLVLVLLDNVRADHVAAYGYPRPTTPQLDELARRGLRFARVQAPSSWTRPSVGSLFTSRLPSEHGAVTMESGLSPAIPTLAEALHAAGYRTVGFSANFVHVSERGGFARGFDSFTARSLPADDAYQELFPMPTADGGSVSLRAPRGDELNRSVLDGLPPAAGGPLFLYVHYMDAHVPWVPTPERWRRFANDPAARPWASSAEVVRLATEQPPVPAAERQRLVDLYDAGISAADAALGELLAALRERGFCGACVVLVTADHGEEFGEHGGWFHGQTLYGESLWVPLVLFDGRAPAGGRVDDRTASLLDVAPTLLSLAGASVPEGMRGLSLLGPATERVLAAELHEDPRLEQAVRPRDHRLALLRWPWKVIVSRSGERRAYELDRDPAEREPLAPEASGAPDEIGSARAADRWLSLRPPAAPADALTPEEREGLRALGYVR